MHFQRRKPSSNTPLKISRATNLTFLVLKNPMKIFHQTLNKFPNQPKWQISSPVKQIRVQVMPSIRPQTDMCRINLLEIRTITCRELKIKRQYHYVKLKKEREKRRRCRQR